MVIKVKKIVKIVVLFLICIYFTSRMPVFARYLGEDEYNEWAEYYNNQQEEFVFVNINTIGMV